LARSRARNLGEMMIIKAMRPDWRFDRS